MKKFSLLLILIVGFYACNSDTNPGDYPNAEAVYLKLEKTYTLNEDGSTELRVFKEQMLLTHRSFHSLYGQTDIYYNPETDSVVVEVAETKTPDGKVVPVPENGYVDMIPGFATGSKEFSHLRHKSVVHTALERNAVIRSQYVIYTKPGASHALMGHELITNDCPVENYTLTVKIPKNQDLNFRQFHLDKNPSVKTKGGYKYYVWNVRNIDQNTGEPNGTRFNREKAQVLFSSAPEFFEVFNDFTSQRAFTFETSIPMRDYLNKKISDIFDSYLILGKIQQMVIDEIQTIPVPLMHTDYRIRPAIETWESMAGTTEEKAVVLASLIRSTGMEATPVAFIPEYLFEKDSSVHSIGNLDLLRFKHVRVTLDDAVLFLDVTTKSKVSPASSYPEHYIVPLEMGYSQVHLEPAPEMEFQTSWDGTVILDSDGKLTGTFEGNFIGHANIFHGLKLNPETLESVYPGEAYIELISPKSTLISFTTDLNNQKTVFADKVQFELPLNKAGFDSWGIRYLPESRTTEMELPHPIREFQRITLAMNERYRAIDFETDITKSNDLGRVSIRYSRKGDRLEVLRSLNISKNRISPEEYPLLRELIDPWIDPAHRKVLVENTR